MKTKNILLGVPILLLSLAACTYDKTANLPPGKYEKNYKSVDANGTERSTESSTNVYYDENGVKRIKVDKETTTDPKGLFNKSTTETHQSIK